MSKQLLFISFLSLILFKGYSQKSTLTLSVGPSFPIGDYAGKSLGNSEAGFAAMGEQVNISFDYKVGKYLNLSAMLYGQRNGLNRKAMERDLSQRAFYLSPVHAWSGVVGTQPPLGVFVTATTYPNWKFNKSAWSMGSFLVGASGEFPLHPSDNLSFIAKVMAGAIYVKSPKLFGESITDTVQARAEQTSESAFGISFLVRSGLKYNLNKKWFIMGSVDYFSTNRIKFNDVKATFTTVKGNGATLQASQSQITADGHQSISSVNLNVGIGVRW